MFVIKRGSKAPGQIRGRTWHDMCFEIETDVWDDDLELFRSSATSEEELQKHYCHMTSDARRNTEVSLRHATPEERNQMAQAKRSEVDQWISYPVTRIVRRAGVPLTRIMSMRWVLTWKDVEATSEAPTGRKAKARLVVKGFTDPDLLTVRAEAPTLSKIARHVFLQVAASQKFLLECGDVKTAFLQGDQEEAERDVYADPPADVKDMLGMGRDEVLKLLGAVYGLRIAPRRWYKRVERDLQAAGWRQHQLDPCLFMLFDGTELVGLCGLYVDDFLLAGREDDPRWQAAKQQLKSLYTWGSWKLRDFTFCGVHYRQRADYSVALDQHEYVQQLKVEDFGSGRRAPGRTDAEEGSSSGHGSAKLGPRDLRHLRGANGALQWLVTNSRIDLAARVSISASAVSDPRAEHLSEAHKILRQAHRYSDVPMVIQSIPLAELRFVVFHDAGWGVRPDDSSQGGYIVLATSASLLSGQEALVSVIDWKSWKLKRMARSSLASEAQAQADAVDSLNFIRLMYAY